jgi:hypothetical protein
VKDTSDYKRIWIGSISLKSPLSAFASATRGNTDRDPNKKKMNRSRGYIIMSIIEQIGRRIMSSPKSVTWDYCGGTMFDIRHCPQCVLRYQRRDNATIELLINSPNQECYDHLREFIIPGQTFLQKWLYFRGLTSIPYHHECLLCLRIGILRGRCAECSEPYEKELCAMIHVGFLCRELVGTYLLADMWQEIMWRIVS